MDHMPWLLERASASGGCEPCGHSLMASCPPEPFGHLTPDVPFGTKHGGNNNNNKKKTTTNSAAPISRNFSRNDGVAPTPANTTTRAGSGHAPTTDPAHPSSIAMEDVGEPAGPPPPRTWELSKADLATLLDLSQKLNLEGEITPVMAWGMVLGHPRLGELGERDLARLSGELRSKVRCYG